MLIEEKSHYIFPTNCFVVNGAERALIYDLHRLDYDIIPQGLSLALHQRRSCSFTELFECLPAEDLDFYEPFIKDLVQKDYLIPVDAQEVVFFEPMNLGWRYPYKLSTAIIEWANGADFDLLEVLSKLDQMSCPAVEIRFREAHDLAFYEALCAGFNGMCFRHMDWLIAYAPGQEEKFMFELKHLNPILFSITQYAAPEDKVIKSLQGQYIGLKTTVRNYDEIVSNHQVHSRNFYVNREFFLEAQEHNNFFNGKIVVLFNGQVKCGTNHENSFGHINILDLETLADNPEFTALWNVGKDEIAVCKDCEYRYMCMDSRIPVKDAEGAWHHTSACAYDPYTCKWAE